MADFTFCARGCQAVLFADGTHGFLDPADGTYYDSEGNDITGYVQNFGGAVVLGPADPALIRAAEGLPAPGGLPPGPSSRTTVPPPPPLPGSPANWFQNNFALIALVGLVILAGAGRRVD
jgi:hypothetical protein